MKTKGKDQTEESSTCDNEDSILDQSLCSNPMESSHEGQCFDQFQLDTSKENKAHMKEIIQRNLLFSLDRHSGIYIAY